MSLVLNGFGDGFGEGPEKSKKVEKSKRLETVWNHWKPSETIGNHSETLEKLRNPWKPSETFENLQKRIEKIKFWDENS